MQLYGRLNKYNSKNDECFEHYFCDNSKKVINLEINKLLNITKTIERNSIVSLFTKKNKPSILYLNTELDNEQVSNIIKTNQISIDEIKKSEPIQFSSSTISLPSDKFEKICTDFLKLKLDLIEIINIGNQIEFRGIKDMETKRRHIININDDDEESDSEENEEEFYIYKGIFNIVCFKHIIKATPLSNRIKLYLCNDQPLIVEYSINNHGILQYFVEPLDIDIAEISDSESDSDN